MSDGVFGGQKERHLGTTGFFMIGSVHLCFGDSLDFLGFGLFVVALVHLSYGSKRNALKKKRKTQLWGHLSLNVTLDDPVPGFSPFVVVRFCNGYGLRGS